MCATVCVKNCEVMLGNLYRKAGIIIFFQDLV